MGSRVVIVGGGIAGLTAAYGLARQGRAGARPFDITLIEADAEVGGQARAYVMDGVTVEHGSHVLFGYYRTIIDLIDELRRDPELAPSMPALIRVPGWTLVDAYGRRATLAHVGWMPGVLGALPSLLRIPWLSLRERLRSAWAAFRIRRIPYARFGELDRKTAFELGREMGYPTMGLLTWNSASLGLTDLFVQEQSGALFAGKHKVLIGTPRGLSYQLVAGNLSDLIANPLAKKLARLGVQIRTSAEVQSLGRPAGAARTRVAYRDPGGDGVIDADHVILAVTPWRAAPLVPWVDAPWTELRPVTPILTMVLRLSGRLAPDPYPRELGLSREHWAFSVVTDLSTFYPEVAGGETLLRCEIGHADRLPRGAETPDDEIVELVKRDVDRLFPGAAGMTVRWAKIHRATKHLYTSWTRGQWSKKPTARDVGQGVFLAGDWATKGTIGLEAAANSGIEAANHVLASAGLPAIPYREVPL